MTNQVFPILASRPLAHMLCETQTQILTKAIWFFWLVISHLPYNANTQNKTKRNKMPLAKKSTASVNVRLFFFWRDEDGKRWQPTSASVLWAGNSSASWWIGLSKIWCVCVCVFVSVFVFVHAIAATLLSVIVQRSNALLGRWYVCSCLCARTKVRKTKSRVDESGMCASGREAKIGNTWFVICYSFLPNSRPNLIFSTCTPPSSISYLRTSGNISKDKLDEVVFVCSKGCERNRRIGGNMEGVWLNRPALLEV